MNSPHELAAPLSGFADTPGAATRRLENLGAAMAGCLLIAVACLVVASCGAPSVARYWSKLPVIVCGAAAVTLAPARWLPWAQTAAVGGLYVSYWIAPWTGPWSVVLGVLPLGLGVLLWRLPLKRRGWRLGTTLLGMSAIPVTYVALVAIDPHAFDRQPRGGIVGGTLAMQLWMFVWAANVLSRQQRSWSLAQCLRAIYVPMAPPAECVRTSLTWQRILIGAASWSCAILLRGVASWAQTLGHAAPVLQPWATATSHPVAFVAASLWAWLVLYANIAAMLIGIFGTCNLFGIPVGFPIDKPWVATNFLDYWRRMDVWIYRSLFEVIFRKGLRLSSSQEASTQNAFWTFVVFAWSGIFHVAEQAKFDLDHLCRMELRWLAEGAICAATVLWVGWRIRRNVRAFRAKIPQRRPHPLVAKAWGVACISIVLGSHGLLHNYPPRHWGAQTFSVPAPLKRLLG